MVNLKAPTEAVAAAKKLADDAAAAAKVAADAAAKKAAACAAAAAKRAADEAAAAAKKAADDAAARNSCKVDLFQHGDFSGWKAQFGIGSFDLIQVQVTTTASLHPIVVEQITTLPQT